MAHESHLPLQASTSPSLGSSGQPAFAQEPNRTTQTRICIRVPRRYHQEPVVSRLISQYGLTVNILAAVLGGNAEGDGWFDLELQGQTSQIDSALTYFNELDLEVWHSSGQEKDGW